jgi:hypothetical protein
MLGCCGGEGRGDGAGGAGGVWAATGTDSEAKVSRTMSVRGMTEAPSKKNRRKEDYSSRGRGRRPTIECCTQRGPW